MSGAGPTPPAARNRLNLIEQLSADAVASDYAVASDDRRPRSRRQQLLVAATAAGLAGFVLAMGLSARVLDAPAVDDQRAALQERIEAATALQDEAVESVARVRVDVEQARAANLDASVKGREIAEGIAALELSTGYAAATGDGVRVTLRDKPAADGAVDDELTRVLDSDVQAAVNGLWSAGAEAVSVDGQRLTAQSAIRSAAGAILVNYRPLQPPYTIEAIGPPAMLADFEASQAASDLRGYAEQYGIGFDTQAADGMTLPAATMALPDQATVIDGEDGNDS